MYVQVDLFGGMLGRRQGQQVSSLNSLDQSSYKRRCTVPSATLLRTSPTSLAAKPRATPGFALPTNRGLRGLGSALTSESSPGYAVFDPDCSVRMAEAQGRALATAGCYTSCATPGEDALSCCSTGLCKELHAQYAQDRVDHGPSFLRIGNCIMCALVGMLSNGRAS